MGRRVVKVADSLEVEMNRGDEDVSASGGDDVEPPGRRGESWSVEDFGEGSVRRRGVATIRRGVPEGPDEGGLSCEDGDVVRIIEVKGIKKVKETERGNMVSIPSTNYGKRD